MFQFTREFIINDNEGKLTGGKKFLAKNGTLFVDNMINIRKQDVNAVYKHVYEDAVNESLTVTLPAGIATETYRLVITLYQEGRVISTYNDYYPEHTREFLYETTGVTDLAKGFKKSFDGEATLSDTKFFNMQNSSTASVLIITAPDYYTRIKEVRVVKLRKESDPVTVGALTGYKDYTVVSLWTRKDGTVSSASGITPKASFTAGTLGNGNTFQILNNMRLLTDANVNPFGLNTDERPVPKGKYTQYLVELVTERRHIGHDVVGSVGTSLTSHVFYVLSDVVSDFDAALTALGVTPVTTKNTKPQKVQAFTKDVPTTGKVTVTALNQEATVTLE